MQYIDWKFYRHPKFLKSLNMTLNERKYLNLFLIKNKFENIENLKDKQETRLATSSKELNSSKFLAQEKVRIYN